LTADLSTVRNLAHGSVTGGSHPQAAVAAVKQTGAGDPGRMSGIMGEVTEQRRWTLTDMPSQTGG
jgi:hypothetical protein